MQAVLGSADEVVRSYSRLIHHVAKRFKWALSPSLEYADLVSEGTVGLLKAYNSFDSRRDVKFASYATSMIQWEIQRHIRERERHVHISQQLYRLAGSILKQNLKDLPPVAIAQRLSCSEASAKRAIEYLKIHIESLDRPAPGASENEKITVQDSIPVSDDLSEVETQEFLRSLPKRERQLIEFRLSGLRQAEIAKKLSSSLNEIGQMQQKIQEKFKRYTEVENMAPLTKEKYLEMKGERKTDKVIYEMYKIGEATLVRMKKKWGLTGRVSVHAGAETSKEQLQPEVVIAQPKVPTAPDPNPIQQLQLEIDGMKPVMFRLERENELLRALLKNYL